MDPDEILDEQLELATKILAGDEFVDDNEIERLAELVTNMHEWMTSGGFLPSQWEKDREKE